MKTNPVTKTYEGKTVLDLPALEFKPGRICAVVGANGSGKTTFARLLAGVIKPDDKKAKPVSGSERVGYMPQYHLL
ncbi:MAG: ATP-binding cassette domain-containing protein, partial [Oscillospiraceae bacterium]|nr:ATP-binding cassette domain-containing protein [Oscillospiraceae bacterium]